jgi:hypothetical protein
MNRGRRQGQRVTQPRRLDDAAARGAGMAGPEWLVRRTRGAHCTGRFAHRSVQCAEAGGWCHRNSFVRPDGRAAAGLCGSAGSVCDSAVVLQRPTTVAPCLPCGMCGRVAIGIGATGDHRPHRADQAWHRARSWAEERLFRRRARACRPGKESRRGRRWRGDGWDAGGEGRRTAGLT